MNEQSLIIQYQPELNSTEPQSVRALISKWKLIK